VPQSENGRGAGEEIGVIGHLGGKLGYWQRKSGSAQVRPNKAGAAERAAGPIGKGGWVMPRLAGLAKKEGRAYRGGR
jgi:hypothetical protein